MSECGHSREVISIHIGQAGIQMGNAIWELLKVEHELDSMGNLLCFCPSPLVDNTGSLFYETGQSRYTPRCLMIDSEPLVVDEIRTDGCCKSFNPRYLISGSDCASGIYGRGYNRVGTELMPTIGYAIRGLLEQSHNLSGVIFYHAIGGGTGSGLTTRIVEHIKDLQLKIPNVHFCIFPSPNITTSILEPYNSTLTLASNGDDSDLMIFVDNESLYKMNALQLNIHRSMYVNNNRRISQIVSGLTSSYRYYTKLSSDFSIFQTNLIPFPDMHYVYIAFSSLFGHVHKYGVEDLTNQCFNTGGQALSVNVDDATFISMCMLYRGVDCNPYIINKALQHLQRNPGNLRFVDWCPTPFKVAISPILPGYVPCTDIPETLQSLTSIINSTGINKSLQNLHFRFEAMLKRKAFLHWFECEGVDLNAMSCAGGKLNDIIQRYSNIQSPGQINRQNNAVVKLYKRLPSKSQSNRKRMLDYKGSTSTINEESQFRTTSSYSNDEENQCKLLNANCSISDAVSRLSLYDFTRYFKRCYDKIQESNHKKQMKRSLSDLNVESQKTQSKEYLSKFLRQKLFNKSVIEHQFLGGDENCQICKSKSNQSSCMNSSLSLLESSITPVNGSTIMTRARKFENPSNYSLSSTPIVSETMDRINSSTNTLFEKKVNTCDSATVTCNFPSLATSKSIHESSDSLSLFDLAVDSYADYLSNSKPPAITKYDQSNLLQEYYSAMMVST